MKGLKKKPGTAPPADLTKLVKMIPGASTKVEMVYVNNQTNNNQQPPPPKVRAIVVLLPTRRTDRMWFRNIISR